MKSLYVGFFLTLCSPSAQGMDKASLFKAHAHAFINTIANNEDSASSLYESYRATLISLLVQEKGIASQAPLKKLCLFLNNCSTASFTTLIKRSTQNSKIEPSDWLIEWIQRKESEKGGVSASPHP